MISSEEDSAYLTAEDAPLEGSANVRSKKDAKKPKKPFTRNSSIGRHEIINMTKAPDHFTQAAGKRKGRIQVNPVLVKALAQYLAAWDEMGSRLFKSNQRVAYEMEMTLSTLSHCIHALTEAGWLTRKSRGMGKPKRWVLHWDIIEANPRRPFLSKHGVPDVQEPADKQIKLQSELKDEHNHEFVGYDEDQVGDVEDEYSLADELLGMCAMFKPALVRLPRASVVKIIASLAKKLTFEKVRLAVRGLNEIQLAKVLNDTTENPPAYLRRVLETAIDDLSG